jgi:hypothetical protein
MVAIGMAAARRANTHTADSRNYTRRKSADRNCPHSATNTTVRSKSGKLERSLAPLTGRAPAAPTALQRSTQCLSSESSFRSKKAVRKNFLNLLAKTICRRAFTAKESIFSGEHTTG